MRLIVSLHHPQTIKSASICFRNVCNFFFPDLSCLPKSGKAILVFVFFFSSSIWCMLLLIFDLWLCSLHILYTLVNVNFGVSGLLLLDVLYHMLPLALSTITMLFNFLFQVAACILQDTAVGKHYASDKVNTVLTLLLSLFSVFFKALHA